MLTAILIDDEKRATTALQKMLNRFCENIQVIAVCNQSVEAASLIKQHDPDVIFLDIDMPQKNGFAVLDAFPQRNFKVIFTTAHNDYAVKAFRYAALDYLLKPISEDDLVAAVARLEKEPQTQQQQIQMLFENLKNLNGSYQKITIATSEGLLFVNVSDIIYCEAQSSYTVFYLKTGNKIMSSKTMKEFEELLLPHSFFRIHHGFLINLNEIKRYVKGEGGTVIMNDNTELPVSKRKKEEFLLRLR